MRHLASPSRAPSSASPSGTTSATDWPYHTIPVSRTARDTLTLLVLMPFWTSFLVRTFAWMILLGRNGAVNRLLISVGLTDAPVNLIFNFTGVMIGMVQCVPILLRLQGLWGAAPAEARRLLRLLFVRLCPLPAGPGERQELLRLAVARPAVALCTVFSVFRISQPACGLTRLSGGDKTPRWPFRSASGAVLTIGAAGTPAHRHRNPSSDRRSSVPRSRPRERRRLHRPPRQSPRAAAWLAQACVRVPIPEPRPDDRTTQKLHPMWSRCLRGDDAGSSVNQPLIQAGGSLAGNDSFDARSTTSRGAAALDPTV
jgi:hypothetical protein